MCPKGKRYLQPGSWSYQPWPWAHFTTPMRPDLWSQLIPTNSSFQPPASSILVPPPYPHSLVWQDSWAFGWELSSKRKWAVGRHDLCLWLHPWLEPKHMDPPRQCPFGKFPQKSQALPAGQRSTRGTISDTIPSSTITNTHTSISYLVTEECLYLTITEGLKILPSAPDNRETPLRI